MFVFFGMVLQLFDGFKSNATLGTYKIRFLDVVDRVTFWIYSIYLLQRLSGPNLDVGQRDEC